MLQYVICEIFGKQYKVFPGVPLEVDFLGNQKSIEVPILFQVDDKIQVGNPYLDKKIKLDVLENFKKEKIRVAKFHAKANFRRVNGHRQQMSRVVLGGKSVGT